MNLKMLLVTTLLSLNSMAHAVDVSSMSQLQNALDNGETDIHVLDGTYQMTENWGLSVNTNSVRIHGNASILGDGMTGGKHVIFQVFSDDVTIEGLTLGEVADHAIMVKGESGADNFTAKNVYFKNCGDQMLKITYDSNSSDFCENGLVEGCIFEFTQPTALDYYTGGIDCHAGKNWIVRENVFRNIVSPTSTVAEHAIHFWSGSENTLVEQNLIINCDRGIGFGLMGRGHVGGIIRNNMISLSPPSKDVGIGLEDCSGAEVYHNTVYSSNSHPFAIEVRFPTDNLNLVKNNLANKAIGIRDNGSAVFDGNVENAVLSDFVSLTDLHLVSQKPAGNQSNLVPNDFDGDLRFENFDVGADEINVSLPPPVRPIGENSGVVTMWVAATHYPNHMQSFINWVKTEIPEIFESLPPDTTSPPDTSTTPPDTVVIPPDSSQIGLITPSDLEYMGAFKLTGNNYAYGGGRALTFYPPNGSLYLNGSDLTGRFAEIQIPSTLSFSKNINDLPSAVVLRSASDATGGLWNPGGQIPRVCGLTAFELTPNNWKMMFGVYDNYDVNHKDISGLGWFSPDFSNPQGRWHVGPKVGANPESIWYGGKHAGYGIVIPTNWQNANTPGKLIAVGRSRGEYNLAESCGPVLTAIDPNVKSDGTFDATCLLSYPTTGAEGENIVPPLALDGYSLTDHWSGVAWFDESVIFFGSKCRYDSHYFDDDGSGGLSDDAGVCGENKGYTCGSEGNSAPGYLAQVLFYDSKDLAKVARGELNPWDPRPYTISSLSSYFIDASCKASPAGIAQDTQNRKLYIVELGAALPDNPVIHVFKVN